MLHIACICQVAGIVSTVYSWLWASWLDAVLLLRLPLIGCVLVDRKSKLFLLLVIVLLWSASVISVQCLFSGKSCTMYCTYTDVLLHV